MVIREEQLRVLKEDFTQRQVGLMSRRILFDFSDELSDRDPVELDRLVNRLFRHVCSLRFSSHPFVYRLVCWGVFFGENYLATFGDGSLQTIAAGPESEEDRFARISATILTPEFAARTASRPAA